MIKSLFDLWNTDKKSIDEQDDREFYIHPKEIWLTKMGKNIGFEEDGKKEFKRPVLVLKKVGNLFLTTAMTSKGKDPSPFYYHIQDGVFYEHHNTHAKSSYIIFSQIKGMDKKRFIEKMGYVKNQEFKTIKEKLKTFLF